MLEKSFGLLFYLKKPKNYENGIMPIYLRITVDGIEKEISVKRSWDPFRWNAKGMQTEIETLHWVMVQALAGRQTQDPVFSNIYTFRCSVSYTRLCTLILLYLCCFNNLIYFFGDLADKFSLFAG